MLRNILTIAAGVVLAEFVVFAVQFAVFVFFQ